MNYDVFYLDVHHLVNGFLPQSGSFMIANQLGYTRIHGEEIHEYLWKRNSGAVAGNMIQSETGSGG